MLDFIIQHPVVILYLAAGWFLAAIISAMPPYSGNNFWLRWLVNIAQIVGASLDKVGQSSQFKQFERTVETTDIGQIAKEKTVEQTVNPTK